MFDLAVLLRPLAFDRPRRAVAPPSWLDYTPFAFWLVDALQPDRLVELGCHTGNSYASFAQAVQTLNLPTACYGVDTWAGDPHAGAIEPADVHEWFEYHDRCFGTFSRLMQATFDRAASDFADGSIDLLHIDGYHTYEAVSHDFAVWLPKMSSRGVVLLHDIGVRRDDFGVWRLWEELAPRYPSFEFRHGHGLGVLGVGATLPAAVSTFLRLAGADATLARQFFARLGAAVLNEYHSADADRLRAENQDLRRALSQFDQLVTERDAELDTLKSTVRGREMEQARPTIVVVSHVGACHPRAGNEYRLNRMFRWYVSRGYRVIPIIAPLPGEELSAEALAGTAELFGNVIQVHRDGRIEHDLRDVPASLDIHAVPSATGHFSDGDAGGDRELAEVDRTFCHDAVIATALHVQQALGPHILQVEYIWMTRFLPRVRADVFKVIDTIDVFSSIDEKVRRFGVRDLVVNARAEAERLRRADLVVAIQPEEHAELRRLSGPVPVVTAGVDFDVAEDAGGSIPGHLLYVASGNPRNRKGLQEFMRFAWPRIRRARPDAELTIAGAAGEALGDRPGDGVRVLRDVADVSPLYRDAALVVNPVVAGTGVKIKTLEALSRLRRIVTWPAGVDGLAPELAARCLVARDWFEFGNLVIEELGRESSGLTGEDRGVIAALLAPELVYAELDAAYREFFTRHGLSMPIGEAPVRIAARVTVHAD